ncbi:alpha/beta fold hydrolase [Dictyobacter arantiisoli]|uniref:Epoxide hydrolase n=1 Tax=Dictyobacter arantiisoli TaxID=2014874 RepID=A0A5A5TET3_9CHLR|nr:alpha/beta hydrolase [Dictyobacter arantiisoli]GCF09656.1 epoxide hydrolase [Dictyobacter arantiisoli]
MEKIPTNVSANDIEQYVEHGYADNNGVKIHYAALGSGPLVVMVHGYPDFWYTWRNQMLALAPHYRVVAYDQRGYNLSNQPAEGEQYAMKYLVGDMKAVIEAQGQQQAIVVGHDWGGAVSWQFATDFPQMTERLIILNLPHPRALRRELAHNPEQQKNSQYARNYQQEGAHLNSTPEKLSAWVTDPVAHSRYIEAFKRTSMEGVLQYYKQNYDRPPYAEDTSPIIKIQASVLQIHGLDDQYLLPGALNDTWKYLERDWTLLTIPHASHFVQHDAADLVSRTILSWLAR